MLMNGDPRGKTFVVSSYIQSSVPSVQMIFLDEYDMFNTNNLKNNLHESIWSTSWNCSHITKLKSVKFYIDFAISLGKIDERIVKQKIIIMVQL